MDQWFKGMLIEAERIRNSRGAEYVRYVAGVGERGKTLGLLFGDTEESLAYRAETAAYILETFEGEAIGSVLDLPLEDKLKIIKRGEEKAGVPNLKSIGERGVFIELVPTLEALEPSIQEAIAISIRDDLRLAGEHHWQRVLQGLERCQRCGVVFAHFEDYQGGYGCSYDSEKVTLLFNRNGNKIEKHPCDN